MMIAVVGGDKATPDVVELAEQVGRELARRGCTVVCGGRGGVMEAACRGARAEGGHTIGILPGPNRRDMNPYVEFPIITGMGYARNAVVVLSGEAVIAVDGSYGTLSEIAHAMQYGKPVVGLATWTFSADGHEEPPVMRARDAVEAVEMAIEAARARREAV
jgi:uncharacterized protein (TIGR00725 family)